MTEDVVTVTDLARWVDASPRTIRRDCASGRIEGARLVGTVWIIPAKSARAYARTREPYDTLRTAGGHTPGRPGSARNLEQEGTQ